MQIEKLQYNNYNTNKLDTETYERIKNDILKNGFLDKTIYHCSDGEIISGNHRVKIAREIKKTSDLKYINLGNLSREERVRLAEMFNTRGLPDYAVRALVYYTLVKKIMEDENLSRKEAEQKIALEFGYSVSIINRYCFMGERMSRDHPWLIKEINDKGAIKLLHASYLLNMDRTRRIYKGDMDVKERDNVIHKMVDWLKDEHKRNKKAVSADRLQAKIRSTLVADFGKELPDLTDVPWASIWYPEKRVESVRHIIENEVELGTYKRDWKFSMNRLTRVSSFPMSIAFNLLRLLTRNLEENENKVIQHFKRWIVVDPFAGFGIRVVTANIMNHQAYGYDISASTIKKVKIAWPEFSNSFSVSDAKNLQHKDESVDLIFTSPPYWIVEKYEETPEQLTQIEEYGQFLNDLSKSFKEMKRIVKVNGYIVLVVGNFRVEGKYYPFVFDVERLMLGPTIEYFDKIILGHDISKPTGGIKSIEKNHTRVAHEEMLIFKKVA